MENRTSAPLSVDTANTSDGLKVSIYLRVARIAHRRIVLDPSAGEQHTAE